ncbi:hypothetical protein, partial [Pseudomonas saponiphila]|uniref:hypothetical protein n=1 Tax=Pseudomonas saponiphila TaxID=556534 RepID=UPI00223E9158
AETLGKAELKGRTFGDTEFVIGHSGSTVPERSGVALSFCGRQDISTVLDSFHHLNVCVIRWLIECRPAVSVFEGFF